MKKTVLRLRRRVGVYGMIGFSVFLLGTYAQVRACLPRVRQVP